MGTLDGTITIKFDERTQSILESFLARALVTTPVTETTEEETTTPKTKLPPVSRKTKAKKETEATTPLVTATETVDTFEAEVAATEDTTTPTPTLEDIKNAFRVYAASPKGGMDKAKALLKTTGYKSLSEIKPEDYTKVFNVVSGK